MRKQITRTELRESFKDNITILNALEEVWKKQNTARYFSKVRTSTRKELKEAFKDKPIILKALMNTWFPKAECEFCSCEYRKKQSHQKYCSTSCRRKKHYYSEKGIARQKRAIESRKKTRQLKKHNLKCGMCSKEYLAERKNQRICSKECKDDYDKYMDKVLKWD